MEAGFSQIPSDMELVSGHIMQLIITNLEWTHTQTNKVILRNQTHAVHGHRVAYTWFKNLKGKGIRY